MQKSGANLALFKSWIVNRKVTKKLANSRFAPFANFIYFKENTKLLQAISNSYDVDSGTFILSPHGDEDDEDNRISLYLGL